MSSHTFQQMALFRRPWIGLDLDASADPVVAVAWRAWGRNRLRTLPLKDASPRLRRRIGSGVRCAAALPWASCLSVALQAPPLPPAKRRRVLPGLLDLKLPFPLEECAHAFVEGADGTLGFAVRHEDLERTLTALKTLGANPERLAAPGWVLWRQALREIPAIDPKSCRAVFLAGTGRTLFVIGTGASYGTTGSVKSGDAEGLRRMLQMAFGRIPELPVCLVAGANAASIARDLTQALSAWTPSVQPVENPGTFLARGLACEALEGEGGSVQLRQPPFEHPLSASSGERAVRRLSWAAMLGAVLLLGLGTVVRSRVAQGEEELAVILSDRLNAVAGYRVATRGTRAVREAEEAFLERLDPVLERQRTPQVSRSLQQVLSQAAGAAVEITHVALDSRGVALSGKAPHREAAGAFAEALRGAGLPVQVEIDARAAEDDVTRFLMTPEVQR